MRFLQPDLHPTHTFSWYLMESRSTRTCFSFFASLSVQQPREPSTHVMAYPQYGHYHPSLALSHGHFTSQGVAA